MEVRKANFQWFQYGSKKLLINDEHKILLEEGKEEPLPTDCLGRGAMRKTNFPRLFVYGGEPGRETVSRMQTAEHGGRSRVGDQGHRFLHGILGPELVYGGASEVAG